MGRAPCCDKNGIKKGPWTPEEDQKLIDYIQENGYGNWRTLPKNAGLQRCGKSCRLRWTNYLRPDIKRGRFSFEEEETIIQLHSILGNKWSVIAARLPGRTDNEIKNYWNTHIRKRLLRMGIDPVTHSPRLDLLDLSAILNSSLYNNPQSQMNLSRLLNMQPLINPELIRLATLLSSQRQNQEFNLMQNHLISHNHDQVSNQIIQPGLQDFTIPTTNFDTANPLIMNHDDQIMPYDDVQQFHQNLDDQFGLHDYVPEINYGVYRSGRSESSTFQSNNSNNLSLQSVISNISTPSNSNYISSSSSNEDERDNSYCSNMMKFEIPDILDVNDHFV